MTEEEPKKEPTHTPVTPHHLYLATGAIVATILGSMWMLFAYLAAGDFLQVFVDLVVAVGCFVAVSLCMRQLLR